MNIFNTSFSNIPFDKLAVDQPAWLWLIPAYLLAYILLKKLAEKRSFLEKCEGAELASLATKTQLIFYHPLASLVDKPGAGRLTQPGRKHLYFILFTLLVVALSQPVYIGKKLPEPPRQRDIVFIVDTSVSMILRDYILQGERVDRMSLLKAVLDNFIQKFKGERMSIVVFGTTAYTMVPLTSDQLLLRNMLKRIQATMAGRFNAMGEAIALAVKQAQPDNSSSTAQTRKRVLVLLTDSDQPTGKIDPLVAAELAKQNNLPIYTVAIGATSPGAEENRKGGLLYSTVDLQMLKNISKITEAKSYHATTTRALSSAIRDISARETNKKKIKPVYYHRNFYYWFVILAILLFIISQIFELFNQAKTPGSSA